MDDRDVGQAETVRMAHVFVASVPDFVKTGESRCERCGSTSLEDHWGAQSPIGTRLPTYALCTLVSCFDGRLTNSVQVRAPRLRC